MTISLPVASSLVRTDEDGNQFSGFLHQVRYQSCFDEATVAQMLEPER